MWQAIGQVTSVLTLIAFTIAVLATIVRRRLLNRERQLLAASEKDRPALIQSLNDSFLIPSLPVDPKRLAPEQAYNLLLEQIRDRSRRFYAMSVLVAFLAVLGASVATYVSVSARPKNTVVEQPRSGFEVYSQHRRLDLSNWQFVPDERVDQKLSAGRWEDVFRVRRLAPEADRFTIRHATSGVPTPEFTSPSHRVEFHETPETPQSGPRPRLRIFDVSADVSGEPVGEWFTFTLQSTYWNAFNDPKQAWAALPIVHPTEQAILEIVFPSNKRPGTWERREGSRDTTTSDLITDAAIDIVNDRQILRWRIERPQRNWVYRINWQW